MSKTSYQIDSVNISPVDNNKLATEMPTGAGANALNINIIHQKDPLVINCNKLEPTDNPLVFQLNSDVAASNGLKSLIVDYSNAGLFGGPTISYDDKLGSITFSEPADTPTLGNANADENEN
ncbi:MAG: hypothetical protein LN546_01130 [Rickettsia endosymbiont of Ecitomorpha arachnoides]|nr:hypothetical protein [Rickettsia endosymbiont of Ecitomorpha arachnoides]